MRGVLITLAQPARGAKNERIAAVRACGLAAALAGFAVGGFAPTRPQAALQHDTRFVACALAFDVAALGASTVTALAMRDG